MPTDGFKAYESKKAKLQAQLLELNANRQPIRLNKETSNVFRQQRQPGAGMDVRSFNQVIHIDPETLTADVEGMTTYEDLVDACLRHNCLPTVVPQLKTITLGGALTGLGIEASSFKYGLVHETISEFEVLLSDSSIVLCRPDNEHKDLFFGFPNSYATLGYALRIKIQLCPIKPYVRLNYQHFTDGIAYFTALNTLCLRTRKKEDNNPAFIEGVVFGKNDMVLSYAECVEEAPYLSDYTYKNIYYRSLKQRKEDYLSIYDYIWRWDSDWFWCSKVFFAENPLVRVLLGKKHLNSAYYGKIRRFFANNFLAQQLYALWNQKSEAIIQDVQIPIDSASSFLAFFEDNIAIKPIWICPTMAYKADKHFDLYPMDADTLYVNFGFWDKKPFYQEEGHYNRLIEKKVEALSGKKSLYSDSYYTDEEFRRIYNLSCYETLKNKYDTEKKLLSLFEKCCGRI